MRWCSVAVVVVVELLQTPENDLRRARAARDELFTFGPLMYLVMEMVGWVVAGMVVEDDMHAGQSQLAGRMWRDNGALSECEVIH